MERRVLISDGQKVTAEDLNEMGLFPSQSFDHITGDGIEPGKAFVDFAVAQTAPTKVTVSAGRLYDRGRVFYNDDSGGTVIDYILSLPSVGSRIAAIVTYGQESATQTEVREFQVDADTGAMEPKPTATEVRRRAVIDGTVVGAEAAAPTRPSVDAQFVVIAWVTLGPAGILDIARNADGLLRSAREGWNRANAVGRDLEAVYPKLTGLENDITKLAQETASKASEDVFRRIMQDIADLKDKAGLPDAFIDYGSDLFLDEAESDKTAAGYSAKIMDGLRFPNAAEAVSEMSLLNAIDARVYTSPKGLVLPSWKDTRYRLAAGGNGEIALNAVSFNNNLAVTVGTMARQRVRFGDEFEVSSASSWWGTGRYTDVGRNIFQKGGEVFRIYPTNRYASDGTKVFRVSKQFVDTSPTVYWQRTATNELVSGFQYTQTFLNMTDRWLTAIGIHPSRLDAAGAITLMLCECQENGQPDENRVIAVASAQPGDLRAGQHNRVPVEPTFLEQGKRYGIIVSSPGNHWMATGSPINAGNGDLFFRATAGFWQHDPTRNLTMDLWIAEFDRTRTEVDLQPVQLVGGVASLDFLAQMVSPAGASAVFEVQVGSRWFPLTNDAAANPLSTLPAVLPLRIVFQGGIVTQPGIVLPGSRVIASRPATALKHVGIVRTLPAATTKIQTVTRIERFNAAKHALTPRLKVGASEVAASTLSDRALGEGIVERTANFVLGSATATFQQVTQASTTDIADAPIVAKAGYVGLNP